MAWFYASQKVNKITFDLILNRKAVKIMKILL